MKTKRKRIEELEKRFLTTDLWTKNKEEAIEIGKELTTLEQERDTFDSLGEEFRGLTDFLEDAGSVDESVRKLIAGLEEKLSKGELKVFFQGKYDRGNAILTITAGAGGQDAQDWATMLHRMYTRYADKKGWQAKEIAHSPGETGAEGRTGTKQVTFEMQGPFAYGFLRKESGVHRLVRLSPFSAKQLRHTSFASLEVLPIINRTEEKDIEISPDDIKVDTFRASGPGGQYVNKRETAIRITHIATGIVVTSQTQRSLQQNKDKALEMLASKLYYKKREEEEKELTSLKGEKKAIEWGSQVRSYVLQPYQLVKDHRTQTETKNVQAVLDGDLDVFIESEVEAYV